MKALSVKQPWAAAILFFGKDVENRTWKTDYRGPLLIHASKTFDHRGFERIRGRGDTRLPYFNYRENMGGIVGLVELVDCDCGYHPSDWAERGYWHWILKDPEPLPFFACRGELGIFEVEYEQR